MDITTVFETVVPGSNPGGGTIVKIKNTEITSSVFCFDVRIGRIELPLSRWQRGILPLNYIRISPI
ncbi:MAG: hypothetical protein UY07_C0006G0051 [Parcubacteria group bacterium GW2011_GWA1_47_8]|nr:MAG: hypothetical protein UY07_C0006G0051 [Parcubacteria group bacterium GW2011_GWA1_47_8]